MESDFKKPDTTSVGWPGQKEAGLAAGKAHSLVFTSDERVQYLGHDVNW